MNKHTVKAHKWIDGILHTVEHYFDNLTEAISFSSAADAHTTKVYNNHGNLVHVTNVQNICGDHLMVGYA